MKAVIFTLCLIAVANCAITTHIAGHFYPVANAAGCSAEYIASSGVAGNYVTMTYPTTAAAVTGKYCVNLDNTAITALFSTTTIAATVTVSTITSSTVGTSPSSTGTVSS
jgi:hypothetical protein